LVFVVSHAMEILNPELMWIGGRCYRVNIPNDDRATVRAINYGEEDDYDDLACELGENDFFEIETIENGSKFQLKVHIPQAFHSQIIGSKGATKKRLEQETSSQITVPKINTKDTTVVIKSSSKRNVVAARNRLDLIVIAGRSKLQFTHFLSVPFTTAEIQKNYAQFKSSVLQDLDVFGIDESLFQKPEKLHLTITTLSLLDNEDRAIAAELLQDCKEFFIHPILQEGLLKVRLAGLNYMNDDPRSVDVLYATVVSEQLQEIANGIDDYFATRGYTHPKNDNVKLHVTLMNSLFRDNDDAVEKDLPREKDRKQQRVTFDASAILNKYKDFFFGEFEISEIHLSQRFSKASNGYYESTGILKF
jgi:activating signal cointegrator complex subunit 1